MGAFLGSASVLNVIGNGVHGIPRHRRGPSKQKPPQRRLASLWWPDPQRKPSQHSTLFGKIAIFNECCDGFYCLAEQSKCRRPNSSNAAGTAVTTMPAPTSVRCTPNVAASHGATARGATPANILPKPMTEFTRPSYSSGAVVCTMVLWSGLTTPQAMPRAIWPTRATPTYGVPT